LQKALPELNSVLVSTRDALIGTEAKHFYDLKQQLSAVEASVNALANGQITLSFPSKIVGYFAPQSTSTATVGLGLPFLGGLLNIC
jgi:hypothetical protein